MPCPAAGAQAAVNIVVAAGVRAILNFSPGAFKVPRGVKLKNMDLTVSLEGLSFFLVAGRRRPMQAEDGSSSHLDAAGRIRMVDVSGKPATAREAVARGRIAHLGGGDETDPRRAA